jgi:hypothetical protein
LNPTCRNHITLHQLSLPLSPLKPTPNCLDHSVDLESAEEILDFVFFIVYKNINTLSKVAYPSLLRTLLVILPTYF